MARPRLDTPTRQIRITLSLRPGEDDDLLAYLSQAQASGAPLAQAIIAAMRGGLPRMAATSDADDDLVDGLLNMIF